MAATNPGPQETQPFAVDDDSYDDESCTENVPHAPMDVVGGADTGGAPMELDESGETPSKKRTRSENDDDDEKVRPAKSARTATGDANQAEGTVPLAEAPPVEGIVPSAAEEEHQSMLPRIRIPEGGFTSIKHLVGQVISYATNVGGLAADGTYVRGRAWTFAAPRARASIATDIADIFAGPGNGGGEGATGKKGKTFIPAGPRFELPIGTASLGEPKTSLKFPKHGPSGQRITATTDIGRAPVEELIGANPGAAANPEIFADIVAELEDIVVAWVEKQGSIPLAEMDPNAQLRFDVVEARQRIMSAMHAADIVEFKDLIALVGVVVRMKGAHDGFLKSKKMGELQKLASAETPEKGAFAAQMCAAFAHVLQGGVIAYNDDALQMLDIPDAAKMLVIDNGISYTVRASGEVDATGMPSVFAVFSFGSLKAASPSAVVGREPDADGNIEFVLKERGLPDLKSVRVCTLDAFKCPSSMAWRYVASIAWCADVLGALFKDGKCFPTANYSSFNATVDADYNSATAEAKNPPDDGSGKFSRWIVGRNVNADAMELDFIAKQLAKHNNDANVACVAWMHSQLQAGDYEAFAKRFVPDALSVGVEGITNVDMDAIEGYILGLELNKFDKWLPHVVHHKSRHKSIDGLPISLTFASPPIDWIAMRPHHEQVVSELRTKFHNAVRGAQMQSPGCKNPQVCALNPDAIDVAFVQIPSGYDFAARVSATLVGSASGRIMFRLGRMRVLTKAKNMRKWMGAAVTEETAFTDMNAAIDTWDETFA